MKVPHHILRLYVRTSRRYKKLFAKLHSETVSAYQRKTFLNKLKKLFKKLRDLEAQLKIAAAAGVVALTLNASPAKAQIVEENSAIGPFIRHDRLTNPLREPIFNYSDPSIAVVDWDKDGDFDVVLGQYDYWDGGSLRYLENRTTQGIANYIELFEEENPFDGIHGSSRNVAPAFVDIDNDGDLDLFLGQNAGNSRYETSRQGVEYYRNDAGVLNEQTGAWNSTNKSGNPLDMVSLGQYVNPVFADLDKDGDQDVIIGSYMSSGYPEYIRYYVHPYLNDGNGNFESSPITVNASFYGWGSIAPAVTDMDSDGDYDILLGTYEYGELMYLQQTDPGVFDPQWDEWDPTTKTGHPFVNFEVGQNASPVFIDFNKDGLLDLFLADEPGYYNAKYSDNIINYYLNTGNNVFVKKDDFENPFDGVYVKSQAAPVVMDLDGDQDLDALIGNKYYQYEYDFELNEYRYFYSTLEHHRKDGGVFVRPEVEETPFELLEMHGNFAPQFVDFDADGDLDMISGYRYGGVAFFRNNDGESEEEVETNPFMGISLPYNASARVVDIDNDKVLDLFVTNSSGGIHYFKNSGTNDVPEWTEFFGDDNPLDIISIYSWNTAFLHFTDLDHDGDIDVLFNGTSPYDSETEAVLFIENRGTPTTPLFDLINESIFMEISEERPKMHMVDYDGDGDLDAFAGSYDGTVSYLENKNIIADITVSESILSYENATAAVPVDANLTLEDEDDDWMVKATVTIEAYQSGEKLAFTPHTDVSGVFDAVTGVLTLSGKASRGDYEDVLRSVTYESSYPTARHGHSSPEKAIIAKTVTFRVFDQDFTTPQAVSRTVEVFVNDRPAVSARTVNVTFGGSASIDLKQIISDPNGTSDLNLKTLKITQQPASGAIASIDGNGVLTLNYNNLTFVGSETMSVEVCDVRGACASNIITINVSNTPPVITPEPVQTPAGTEKAINLMSITTDVDGNLNPDAFTIVTQPISRAVAQIEVVSPTIVNLLLDYKDITFHGTDEITIRACDHVGACSENLLTVQVDVDASIIVYNAVAPNSTGDNKFMRITGLPQKHKVTIFSRWGDKVFDSEDYDAAGDGNAFSGSNNNGKALPTGIYFYTIEIPGEKKITGYLTLKQ